MLKILILCLHGMHKTYSFFLLRELLYKLTDMDCYGRKQMNELVFSIINIQKCLLFWLQNNNSVNKRSNLNSIKFNQIRVHFTSLNNFKPHENHTISWIFFITITPWVFLLRILHDFVFFQILSLKSSLSVKNTTSSLENNFKKDNIFLSKK